MQEKITIDDYMASRYVCEPLHLLDYCLINDGGVALIISESSIAKKISPQPVFIEALGRSDMNRGATTLEPRLTEFYLPGQLACANQVFNAAGIGPNDIDVAQIYDSFSVHVPLALEVWLLCSWRRGQIHARKWNWSRRSVACQHQWRSSFRQLYARMEPPVGGSETDQRLSRSASSCELPLCTLFLRCFR